MQICNADKLELIVCRDLSQARNKGTCSDLMVSALHSRESGLGSSPGCCHCVVLLGKTLNSHSASLHTGV